MNTEWEKKADELLWKIIGDPDPSNDKEVSDHERAKKEVIVFITKERDEAYKEGARVQAEMDADTIQKEREAAYETGYKDGESSLQADMLALKEDIEEQREAARREERERYKDFTEIAKEMMSYIEKMEETVDGEWGSCRDWPELYKAGYYPEVYDKLKAITHLEEPNQTEYENK